jgi:hypothetical protein
MDTTPLPLSAGSCGQSTDSADNLRTPIEINANTVALVKLPMPVKELAQLFYSMNTPTPETDAETTRMAFAGEEKVTSDFARRLERERDEARAALSGRTVSCSLCNESAMKLATAEAELSISNDERDHYRRENIAMREAIKDAHYALGGCLKYILSLPLSGSDAECETMDDAHHALRKLQPFLK